MTHTHFEMTFLNLSNHPLSTWSQEQLEAARALGFGEPRDLDGGMPLVDPAADEGVVAGIAEDLAQQAVAAGADGVFVAGDFTLTFALVKRLQARGIRCYATTTARTSESINQPDGSIRRVNTFRFVRFREYG